MQLLLFAIFGLAPAFVPSFELYMVLRFAVATAVAGFTFSNVTLREYLGTETFNHRARPWGLGWPHSQTGCGGLVRTLHLEWSHGCSLCWD